jgi:hypothetical protein
MCPVECKVVDLGEADASVLEEGDAESPAGSAERKGPRFVLSVVVGEPARRVAVELPRSEAELGGAIAAELEDLYRLYGSTSLDGLDDAIASMGEVKDVAPLAAATAKAFRGARKALEEEIDAQCATVEEFAAASALARLDESLEEIELEGVRYLAGQRNRREVATLLKRRRWPAQPLTTWELKKAADGGEAEDLIRTLVQLRKLQELANRAQERAQASLDELVEQGAPDAVAATLPGGSPELLFRSRPALKKSREDAESASVKLNEALIAATLQYPIIHRLHCNRWLPRYPEDQSFLLYDPRGKPGQYRDFCIEVFGILRDAWGAATGLRADIAASPKLVWSYRPLIAAALEECHQNDTTVTARAAQEKLNEAGVKDWIDSLAAVAASAQLTAQLCAFVTAPDPPLALALEAASVILGGASLGLEGLAKYEESIAAKAALDPSKSLAAEPSWGFYVLMTALQLTSLRSLASKVGQTKTAARIVPFLKGLVR